MIFSIKMTVCFAIVRLCNGTENPRLPIEQHIALYNSYKCVRHNFLSSQTIKLNNIDLIYVIVVFVFE